MPCLRMSLSFSVCVGICPSDHLRILLMLAIGLIRPTSHCRAVGIHPFNLAHFFSPAQPLALHISASLPQVFKATPFLEIMCSKHSFYGPIRHAMGRLQNDSQVYLTKLDGDPDCAVSHQQELVSDLIAQCYQCCHPPYPNALGNGKRRTSTQH